MPITEHTVKTRRHTTFYLAAGPENGPLVIFVHGWPEDANVYKFVKLLFRKGDPAREGQRAFTATARRSHSFLGMSPIPDLPRDNDVVTEEDLSIYVSALERIFWAILLVYESWGQCRVCHDGPERRLPQYARLIPECSV